MKIKPFSQRPNLLGEVSLVKKKTVRLAGGDLPVGETSESDWYYPSSSSFTEGATSSGNAGDDAPAVSLNAPNITSVEQEDRDDDRCGF